MADTDQAAVVAFLSSGSAYGSPSSAVQRVDTHISVVWLVEDRAYKLKRAVHFDYVDFSTLERRRAACDAEVRVNRRTAPSLYRGVRAVTRDAAGTLTLGGSGEPVEWLVEMTRFDERTLFDRLAERHELSLDVMPALARAIARLHLDAEADPLRGGHASMSWVVDGNARGFEELGSRVLAPEEHRQLTEDSRAALDAFRDRLDTRGREGFVRVCHGDLHLRNICLVDGAPTLFDAVEFNDNISRIDVLYDLAFLLMDLWRRSLQAHANIVFNEYLGQTLDFGGLPLLPLFLSCRAAVRAKTSLAAIAVQADAVRARESERAANEYLRLAADLLRPVPARLIAIGGFSGSGKSTLARALGPSVGRPPGAVVIRSDLVRKALSGVSPLTRLGPEAYGPETTTRVYEAMAARADVALRSGQSVITDAVFGEPSERRRIEDVARAAGAAFSGLWLEGPEDVLTTRLATRSGDASDATPAVLQMQQRRSIGALGWQVLDGSRAREDVLEVATTRLHQSAS